MGSTPPAFSPEDALATLRDLAHAETRLTARTVGTTLMLWGLLTGALILAIYAFDARDGTTLDMVAVPLLMVLIVAAGIATTNTIWKSRALGLNAGFRPARVWMQGLGVTAGAFALVVLLGNYVVNTNFAVYFTLAAGLVMLYVGIRHQMAPWCRFSWSLVAAGLLIANGVLMLILLETGPEPDAAASLWGALATGTCTFLAGALHARLG